MKISEAKAAKLGLNPEEAYRLNLVLTDTNLPGLDIDKVLNDVVSVRRTTISSRPGWIIVAANGTLSINGADFLLHFFRAQDEPVIFINDVNPKTNMVNEFTARAYAANWYTYRSAKQLSFDQACCLGEHIIHEMIKQDLFEVPTLKWNGSLQQEASKKPTS